MNGCAYCERALLAVNRPATHVTGLFLSCGFLSISIALPLKQPMLRGGSGSLSVLHRIKQPQLSAYEHQPYSRPGGVRRCAEFHLSWYKARSFEVCLVGDAQAGKGPDCVCGVLRFLYLTSACFSSLKDFSSSLGDFSEIRKAYTR